jgi:hypothetical protein
VHKTPALGRRGVECAGRDASRLGGHGARTDDLVDSTNLGPRNRKDAKRQSRPRSQAAIGRFETGQSTIECRPGGARVRTEKRRSRIGKRRTAVARRPQDGYADGGSRKEHQRNKRNDNDAGNRDCRMRPATPNGAGATTMSFAPARLDQSQSS